MVSHNPIFRPIHHSVIDLHKTSLTYPFILPHCTYPSTLSTTTITLTTEYPCNDETDVASCTPEDTKQYPRPLHQMAVILRREWTQYVPYLFNIISHLLNFWSGDARKYPCTSPTSS